MPPGGFKVGDRVRLPDGDEAIVVPDHPERADRQTFVCILRQYNITTGKPENLQFETMMPNRLAKI